MRLSDRSLSLTMEQSMIEILSVKTPLNGVNRLEEDPLNGG